MKKKDTEVQRTQTKMTADLLEIMQDSEGVGTPFRTETQKRKISLVLFSQWKYVSKTKVKKNSDKYWMNSFIRRPVQ